MIKKILMIILLACFIFGLALTFIIYKGRVSPSTISLPAPTPEPTLSPTLTPSSPTISVVQPKEIENDLKNIEEDLKKIKEDKRIDPPEFLFDLGI